MSIEQFSFSKSWRDREAFPTYEDDETQVRDDLQCLHDELAAYVNETVVPRLNADESGIQQNTQAISDLQTAVAGVTLGQIPDGSLTAAKLAPGGAAGWEDVSSAIALAAQGSSVVEVAAKRYFYSRTLGIMVLFLQLWVTAEAGDSVVLDQDGYPAALYLPSSPLSVHRRGCVAFLRDGYNGHDLSVWVSSQDAMSRGTVCVSGWYFCSGEESA
jgi:hypothetical protein